MKLAFAILSSMFLVTVSCFADVPYELFISDANEIQMLNKLTIARSSEAIRLEPTNAIHRTVRAMLYLHEGKFEEAIKDCDESIRLGSNNYYTYYLRGIAYFETGDYDKAIADYNKLIGIKPDIQVYLARGLAYIQIKDYSNSLADCNEAIRLDPALADSYVDRGMVNDLMGNYDKAIADYSEAIRIKPGSYYYFLRGGVYAEEASNDKAAADYSEAVVLNPQYALAYANRGLVIAREGNYSNGIADCSRAIQIDTNCAVAYNNLAWLLAVAPDSKLRNGQKAVEYATRACELSSWKEPYSLGTLAAAYAENGNFDEAVKWEKKCMESGLPDKEMPQARNELDFFQHQKPYHAGKNSMF